MKVLCEWILNGKGRGKRYLLLLAIIFAGMCSSVIYISWNNFLNSPATQEMLSSIPNLKLQNGMLTEPIDTYQKINWRRANSANNQLTNFQFIIDTKNDDIDTQDIKSDGIYLSRKNAYIQTNGNLTIQPLKKIPNFEIKQGELNNILKRGNFRFSGELSILERKNTLYTINKIDVLDNQDIFNSIKLQWEK